MRTSTNVDFLFHAGELVPRRVRAILRVATPNGGRPQRGKYTPHVHRHAARKHGGCQRLFQLPQVSAPETVGEELSIESPCVRAER